MRLLLDTHFWIWWLTADAPITRAERTALDNEARSGGLCVSAISLWETQLLHSKSRLELPLKFPAWLTRATDPAVVTVLPIDRDVIIALDGISSNFHGDPADRLIIATARAHGLPMATRDRAIRRSRAIRLWKA